MRLEYNYASLTPFFWYNSLVDQFHYLGYSQIVGNHLKYMAFAGDVPLASKVMVLNTKRISDDWNRVYHFPLYLLETFVEQNRFKGTCYQAANWIRVGETKGTSKKGHKHLKHDKIKDVYVYPLHKLFKKLLTGNEVSQTV